MLSKNAGARTAEAKLLAMAGRLFKEYEQLPVRTVFQAIGGARTELRANQVGAPTPEDIEMLARRRLEAARSGTARDVGPR